MKRPKRTAFIMLKRGRATEAIARDPNGLALLLRIALTTRRSEESPNPCGVKVGQALIGFEGSGMSEKEYRAAKKRLERQGLAGFKGTKRGTIAWLTGNRIFDLNLPESTQIPVAKNGAEQRADLGAEQRADPIGEVNPSGNGSYDESVDSKGGLEGGDVCDRGATNKEEEKNKRKNQENNDEGYPMGPDFAAFEVIVRAWNECPGKEHRCNTRALKTAAWRAFRRTVEEFSRASREHRAYPRKDIRNMILRAVENYAQAWQHYPRADRDWGLVTFLQSANDSPLWGYVPGSYSLANLDFVATTPDRPRPARPNLKSGPLAGSGV